MDSHLHAVSARGGRLIDGRIKVKRNASPCEIAANSAQSCKESNRGEGQKALPQRCNLVVVLSVSVAEKALLLKLSPSLRPMMTFLNLLVGVQFNRF